MNTYETLYLINETIQLGGNALMDTLSVIFALVVTGYVAGSKLTRSMLWGLAVLSALFVMPMIGVLITTFDRAIALADSLPRDQFEAMPYLAAFANPGAVSEIAPSVAAVSLAVLYAGAIYFIFHCHSKGTVTAAS